MTWGSTVRLVVSGTTRATTRPPRSIAPQTGCLADENRVHRQNACYACLFFSFPPMKVSSVSTDPNQIVDMSSSNITVRICVEHSPRGFVGNTKFPLKLFRGDTASGACHQVHRVEPEMQRRGRLVEDRTRSRMQVMSACRTGPRLPLLFGRVSLKRADRDALRAARVGSVR